MLYVNLDGTLKMSTLLVYYISNYFLYYYQTYILISMSNTGRPEGYPDIIITQIERKKSTNTGCTQI